MTIKPVKLDFNDHVWRSQPTPGCEKDEISINYVGFFGKKF